MSSQEVERQNDRVSADMARLKETVLAGTAAFTQDAIQKLRNDFSAECASEVASFLNGVGFQKLREELHSDVSVEISAAAACAQASVQEMVENMRRDAAQIPNSLLTVPEVNPATVSELHSHLDQREEELRQELGAKLGAMQAQFAAQLEGLRQELSARFAMVFDGQDQQTEAPTTTIISTDVEHRLGKEIEAMRLEIAAQTELMLEKVSEVQLFAESPRIEAAPAQPGLEMSSEHLRALSQLVTTVAAIQGEISVLRDDCGRATTVLGIHVEKHLERDIFDTFREETRRELATVTESMNSLRATLAGGGEEAKPGRRAVKDGGTGAEPGTEEKAILLAHIEQIEDQIEALHRRVEEVFKSYHVQSQVVKEIAAKCKPTADGQQSPSAKRNTHRGRLSDAPQGLQISEVQDAFRRFQGDVETRLKVETLHRETLEARVHELQALVKDQDGPRPNQPAPRGRRSVGDAAARGRSPQDHSEGRESAWDPMKRISRSPSRPSSHDGLGSLVHTGSAPALDAQDPVPSAGSVTPNLSPKFVKVERPGLPSMTAVRSMHNLSRAASQSSSLHVPPPPSAADAPPKSPQATPQSGTQSPQAFPQSPSASPQSQQAVWMHSRRQVTSGLASSPSASGKQLRGTARVPEGGAQSATRSSMSRQLAASRGSGKLITASGGHDGEPPRLIMSAANRLARSQASE